MSNWNEFKKRSLWQHSIWGEFQKSIGRKTWILNVDGASALVVQHKMPFGLNWLEVPRGPLFKNEESLNSILDKIQEIGKSEQSVFIRTSSYEQFLSSKFEIKNSKKDHHPETSLIIDLSQSEEEILAQMKPKGRYNIKVAERHNVSVKKSDDICKFYDTLAKTSDRDGFNIHPKTFYEKIMKSLGKSVQLFLAEYEGRIVAGGIFVFLDEWGIYYYGASDHNYRKVMAPYLVQWEAIKEAKFRGCKYYDFLGIAPESAKHHAWAGVTSFKKKFGGEIKNYPQAKEVVLRPYWYFLYSLYKKFK